MNTSIAIDAMGGDHGLSVTIPAALEALDQHAHLQLILVGDSAKITTHLTQLKADDHARITIKHTSQCVDMDESPAQALRMKKDSSMRVAINIVKEGGAQACVSAGNTGALMATARYVLKTIRGIDRPAIISTLPTTKGHVHVLDLGANVDSTPEQLFQFAVMGALLTAAVDNTERPTIALLNIGTEEIKGKETIKRAAELLANSSLNYQGYIEANDIYQGKVDVVVCDGFDGNMVLKSSEGVAKMIGYFLRQEFCRTPWNKMIALLARPILKSFQNKIDPRRYNGATFIGLKGTVIKSHGGADVLAFTHAIKEAIIEAEKNIPELISNNIAQFLDNVENA